MNHITWEHYVRWTLARRGNCCDKIGNNSVNELVVRGIPTASLALVSAGTYRMPRTRFLIWWLLG